MKITIFILGFIVFSFLLNACKKEPRSNPVTKKTTVGNIAPNYFLKDNSTFEEKLKFLEPFSIKLQPPFTSKDLLSSWSRQEYEMPGIDLVLVALGMTEEKEPWRNHSANLWHFDTECIEDNGDYKRIVQRMVEITQGSLILDDIRDYVDHEKKEAWFSFKFKEKQIKVNCDVEDDWVDTKIFAKFVEYLEISDPRKVYIYYDLGGQDSIIGCIKKDDLQKLNEAGIKFVPLS